MTTRSSLHRALASALVAFGALVTAACGTPTGSERGQCFPNGTCNAGLTCVSNLCVVDTTGDGSSSDASDVQRTDTPSTNDIVADTGDDTSTTQDVAPTDAPEDTGMTTDDVPMAQDVVCMGSHPLLDAGARFCAPSDCYCPPQGAGMSDTCYPEAIARTCCARGVVCPGDDAGVLDAAVCMGTHPLLDAGARFCGPGVCYCPPTPGGTGEACYPMAVAMTCCPRTVTCY